MVLGVVGSSPTSHPKTAEMPSFFVLQRLDLVARSKQFSFSVTMVGACTSVLAHVGRSQQVSSLAANNCRRLPPNHFGRADSVERTL